MRSIVILTVIFVISTSRNHFRSVLLERACQKRPSLSFCDDFTTSTTTSTITTTATPEASTTTKSEGHVLNLVPPPSFHDLMKATTSTTTASPTTEKNDDLGSLLRLPKPAHITSTENEVPEEQELQNSTLTNTIVPTAEDEKTVLVYVSDYCVAERERFVKLCHGTVAEVDMTFCKAYPPACASAPGVLPVISYCQRYYKQYPKYCTAPAIVDTVIQFCYAFEQFCLPELTPAQSLKEVTEAPKSTLKRCEDVLVEARKVCNPFPNPKDTFNVVRCTNFLTNCKEFIDWA